MLERNGARENQKSGGEEKGCAVAQASCGAEEKTSKIRRGGGEGGGREGEDRAAPGSQARHLGGPGPNAGRAKSPPHPLREARRSGGVTITPRLQAWT